MPASKWLVNVLFGCIAVVPFSPGYSCVCSCSVGLTVVHVTCAGVLYAITGSNIAGENFKPVHAITRINKATGASSLYCTLASLDVIQAFAFVDATTIMYFTGSTTPALYTINTATQVVGGNCATTPVTAYTTSAKALFNTAPVVAAAPLGDGATVIVTLGTLLYTVTRTGVVTAVGTLLDIAASTPLSAASLSFTGSCTSPTTITTFAAATSSAGASGAAIGNGGVSDGGVSSATSAAGSDTSQTAAGSGSGTFADVSVDVSGASSTASSADNKSATQSSGLLVGVAAAVVVVAVAALVVTRALRKRRNSSVTGSSAADVSTRFSAHDQRLRSARRDGSVTKRAQPYSVLDGGVDVAAHRVGTARPAVRMALLDDSELSSTGKSLSPSERPSTDGSETQLTTSVPVRQSKRTLSRDRVSGKSGKRSSSARRRSRIERRRRRTSVHVDGTSGCASPSLEL